MFLRQFFYSYEEKVIVKYRQIKYNYGSTRIGNDYSEYEWNVNGIKKLLKKIDETGDVARKEGSGRPKSVRTEENIEQVEEMILSKKDQPETHSTLAEIALELNVDHRSVFCIIDQDLGPLKN